VTATTTVVMLRESGAFSIPEAALIDREVSAYWVARSRLRHGFDGLAILGPPKL
jgi:hypothetical protein